LFGYEKGAFTGAKVEGKPGFFELANKGTLFLDEIGEIPLSTQTKLLRFLEDHEIIRIGGREARKIDVRVVAATNRKIEDMLATKVLRQDLFYRLNVVPIHIPPLRDRRDDIVPLLVHFLEKFNVTCQKSRFFSQDSIEAFSEYNFPGNIRELANLVERIVVMADRDRIEMSDLPDELNSRQIGQQPFSSLSNGESLREVLKEYESLIIRETTKKCNSQRQAAKMLGIDQATLCRKMKKYSIPAIDVLIQTC